MPLKVMTWNLENLFRNGNAFGPKTKAIYEEKLQALATIISEQAPDALAVQEVGDPKALVDLVNLLDGTWHQRVSQHPDGRGIRVAWLSPLSIANAQDIVSFLGRSHRSRTMTRAVCRRRWVVARWQSPLHPTRVRPSS